MQAPPPKVRRKCPAPAGNTRPPQPPVDGGRPRPAVVASPPTQGFGQRRGGRPADRALPRWKRKRRDRARGWAARSGPMRFETASPSGKLPHGRGAAVRPRLGARIRPSRHAGCRARVRDHPTPRAPAELCPGYRYHRYNCTNFNIISAISHWPVEQGRTRTCSSSLTGLPPTPPTAAGHGCDTDAEAAQATHATAQSPPPESMAPPEPDGRATVYRRGEDLVVHRTVDLTRLGRRLPRGPSGGKDRPGLAPCPGTGRQP